MPSAIHEQGYRRYEARGPLRQLRFWPITREALRMLLQRKAFLALLALAWVQLVARAIQIWVVTQYPQAGRLLPIDGRLYGDFLSAQVPFVHRREQQSLFRVHGLPAVLPQPVLGSGWHEELWQLPLQQSPPA